MRVTSRSGGSAGFGTSVDEPVGGPFGFDLGPPFADGFPGVESAAVGGDRHVVGGTWAAGAQESLEVLDVHLDLHADHEERDTAPVPDHCRRR
jgi:hypothetical protein